MKYVLLFFVLNSCLFAGNDIIIKASADKLSFELYGSYSAHMKVDTANFKLKIHNYSDKKFFIIDPEVIDLKPGYDPGSEYTGERVFIHYGGYYQSAMSYWRLKVLGPGDSIEFPIQIDIKILNPIKPFNSYFVQVDIGYFQYDKHYEYLTKKEDDSNFVYFKSISEEINFSVTHKFVELCCMPIFVNLMKQNSNK